MRSFCDAPVRSEQRPSVEEVGDVGLRADVVEGAEEEAEDFAVAGGEANAAGVGQEGPANSFHFKTVTEAVVEKAIRKSKGSRCPDIAGISPIVLKLAPDVIAVPLAFIINKSVAIA